MFKWNKSLTTLETPAGKVIHLFRSMRDVQLALPGLPAQEASAYLCQHEAARKVATTVIFHLLTSGQLAFYVEQPREVDAGEAAGMLERALMFIESMGFLMTDLDIHLLAQADRELLWNSLPLARGVAASAADVPGAKPPEDHPLPSEKPDAEPPQPPPATAEPPAAVAADAAAPAAEHVAGIPAAVPAATDPRGVDDLLAAVEALRTRRAEPRSRRKPPGAEELQRRRRELTGKLGRILASL